MALIRVDQPWYEQPLGHVAVDWSNPLTLGLQRCVVCGYAVDIAQSSELLFSSAVQGVGSAGACRVYSGAQYDSFAIPPELAGAASGTPATVAAVYELSSSTTQRVVSLGFQSASGGIAITPSSTQIRGIAVNSSSGNVIVSGATAQNGPLYSTVFSSADTARLYVDSNAVVSASVSGGQRWVGAEFFRVGSDELAGSFLNGRVYLACAWSRELTEAEARSFNANPWQLFEPHRIWVPQAAASGLPTLGTVSAAAITSSGFRPSVTYTY